MAKASPAKIRANANYAKKIYDAFLVSMPKGKKAELRALADAEGMSLNRYILEAVEARSGLKLTLDGEFKGKKSENG